MENEICKEPEIIARLNLLQEKIRQLRDKLSPVTIDTPKCVENVPVKSSSQSMFIINQTINLIDDIKDSIDIN